MSLLKILGHKEEKKLVSSKAQLKNAILGNLNKSSFGLTECGKPKVVKD